jgi:glycosyltransferase involved in cell wall biosynthesis
MVSIVVPVYNRAGFIRRCLESAQRQTVTDIEIVVVDNASTDGTWEICCEIARTDERIRPFRNASNIGPVLNWRRGLEGARGRIGKLLFSDDLIRPAFLERTLPFLENPEVAFVYTALDRDPEAGAGQSYFRWRQGTGIWPSDRYVHDALFALGACQHSPGAGLFRIADLRRFLRSTFPSPRFTDFADHGGGPDLGCFLFAAAHYPKVGYLDEPLAYFESHSDSITSSRRYKDLFNRYHQTRIQFAIEHGTERVVDRLLAQAWLQNCLHARRILKPSDVSAWFVNEPPPMRFQTMCWAAFNESHRWPHYFRRAAHLAAALRPLGPQIGRS